MKSTTTKFAVTSLMLLFLTGLYGCIGDDSKDKQQEKALPVRVIKIQEKDFPVMGEYVAQVEARKTVEIRARVQGHLEERNFDEGQIVEKGQLLFIIDPRPYEETVKRAQAALDSAKASLRKAVTDYQRFQTLYKQGAVSREEFDTKATDRRVLDANVSNAKAELEQAKLNLGFTHITAPMTGIIGRTNVNQGALIAQESTVLATISDIDPIYVSFSIPEQEYLIAARALEARKEENLKAKPLPLRIKLADGGFYNYNGTFNMADRAVDPSTGTLGIRAEFPNPDRILRDGQYAKVVVQLKEFKDALIVPSRAVLELQGRNSLLTVAANGTVVEKPITIAYENDSNAVVSKGIEDGALIIADGVNKIRPGTLVDPQIAGATPAKTEQP